MQLLSSFFIFVPCKRLEHIVCSNTMAHLEEHKHHLAGNMLSENEITL